MLSCLSEQLLPPPYHEKLAVPIFRQYSILLLAYHTLFVTLQQTHVVDSAVDFMYKLHVLKYYICKQ